MYKIFTGWHGKPQQCSWATVQADMANWKPDVLVSVRADMANWKRDAGNLYGLTWQTENRVSRHLYGLTWQTENRMPGIFTGWHGRLKTGGLGICLGWHGKMKTGCLGISTASHLYGLAERIWTTGLLGIFTGGYCKNENRISWHLYKLTQASENLVLKFWALREGRPYITPGNLLLPSYSFNSHAVCWYCFQKLTSTPRLAELLAIFSLHHITTNLQGQINKFMQQLLLKQVN